MNNAVNFLLGCLIGCILFIPKLDAAAETPKREPIDLQKYTVKSDNETKALGVVYESTPDNLEEELYYDSLELLACCVEAEAGNQGLIGKKYVVDVILNRVDHEDFPDNITDVIYQKNQFSVVSNGAIDRVSPTDETFQAVKEELEERTNSEVLYFTSKGFHPCGTDWKKIGDHYFSTE